VTGLVVVVLALRPPAPVAAAIAVDGAAIVWMLLRLRATTDPVLELVTIGTAAKAGNAGLLAVIAWLLLAGQDAPGQATLLVVSITAVAAWNVLTLARHPERARIAYKPPASA
jgi:hypothetical protein